VNYRTRDSTLSRCGSMSDAMYYVGLLYLALFIVGFLTVCGVERKQ
jgi:hypothetical protein